MFGVSFTLLLVLRLRASAAATVGARATSNGVVSSPGLSPTTHSCEGKDDFTRVCIFRVLVLLNGTVTYLYKDRKPELPRVCVKFATDLNAPVFLDLSMQDISKLGKDMTSLPIVQLGPSVFEDSIHMYHYYHIMSENLVAMYLKGCMYLGHCNDTHVRYFLYHSTLARFEDFHDWNEHVPWVQNYLDCFTDYPVRHPNHTSFSNQIGVMSEAVFGIGSSNRHYTYMHTDAFREHYERPEPQTMELFRQHMFKCFDIQATPRKRDAPIEVVIIQRGDNEHRHLLNAAQTRKNILHDFSDVASVRIFTSVEHRVRDQLLAVVSADILIQTHGSAMGNLLFMRQGSVLIEYFYYPEMDWHFTHRWSREVIEDTGINVHMVALTCSDTDYVEWDRLMFVQTPEYKALPSADKVRFHEFKHTNQSMPGADPVHSALVVYHTDFYIKYGLLR